MRRRRDEVGGLTKQFRQHVASSSAGSKEFAVDYTKLELHKTNPDSLEKAIKLSRKKVAITKYIVVKQGAQLDAAGARTAQVKNRRDTQVCRLYVW